MTGSDLPPYVAFLALGAINVMLRLGGFWLMGFVPLSPRVRHMLEALPGSVVMATIVPLAAHGGAPAALAMLTGLGVMLVWRNDFLALAAGMSAAALLRAFSLG